MSGLVGTSEVAHDEGELELAQEYGVARKTSDLTSAQAESALSEGGVFWPAHPDAPPPSTLPRLADLHPVASPPPSPADATNIQAFLKKFKTVFGRQ